MTAASNEVVELLPCPFCGGEAVVGEIGGQGSYCWVGCKKCAASVTGYLQEHAIAAWNTRAHSDPRPVAEGLREVVARAIYSRDPAGFLDKVDGWCDMPWEQAIEGAPNDVQLAYAIADAILPALATHSPAPMAGEERTFKDGLREAALTATTLAVRLSSPTPDEFDRGYRAGLQDLADNLTAKIEALAAHPSTQEGSR